MPDDLDNAPSESSELDPSEDDASTGKDVQRNRGVLEGEPMQPDSEEKAQSEVDKDLGESIEEA